MLAAYPRSAVCAGNGLTLPSLDIFVGQAAEPVPPQNADTRASCGWMQSPGERVLQRPARPVLRGQDRYKWASSPDHPGGAVINYSVLPPSAHYAADLRKYSRLRVPYRRCPLYVRAHGHPVLLENGIRPVTCGRQANDQARNARDRRRPTGFCAGCSCRISSPSEKI